MSVNKPGQLEANFTNNPENERRSCILLNLHLILNSYLVISSVQTNGKIPDLHTHRHTHAHTHRGSSPTEQVRHAVQNEYIMVGVKIRNEVWRIEFLSQRI